MNEQLELARLADDGCPLDASEAQQPLVVMLRMIPGWECYWCRKPLHDALSVCDCCKGC